MWKWQEGENVRSIIESLVFPIEGLVPLVMIPKDFTFKGKRNHDLVYSPDINTNQCFSFVICIKALSESFGKNDYFIIELVLWAYIFGIILVYIYTHTYIHLIIFKLYTSFTEIYHMWTIILHYMYMWGYN